MIRALEVVRPGSLTTVQDAGRTGQAALGIGRSGACDRRAHALANRLVGNLPDAAVLEVTFGALAVRARGAVRVRVLEQVAYRAFTGLLGDGHAGRFFPESWWVQRRAFPPVSPGQAGTWQAIIWWNELMT